MTFDDTYFPTLCLFECAQLYKKDTLKGSAQVLFFAVECCGVPFSLVHEPSQQDLLFLLYKARCRR